MFDGKQSAPQSCPVKQSEPLTIPCLTLLLFQQHLANSSYQDKYLRSVAEFRNLQERTRREVVDAKSFAISKFARDLIETVDTFDLALANVPADKLSDSSDEATKDLRLLHGGLEMTERILMNTLKKHGLERFDPSVQGDKFDPNIHDATFMAPQDGKEDGSVFHTTQKGFTLNGRVIRVCTLLGFCKVTLNSH